MITIIKEVPEVPPEEIENNPIGEDIFFHSDSDDDEEDEPINVN